MDRLDAIRLFLRVVESGSFSAAGKEVHIGQSAVSKKIAGLESWLNTQLLYRSSRGLSLTESGRQFYAGCLRLSDEFSALETQVRQGHAEASGLLRVAVAPVFGRLYILPHLPAFFARYPAINVELVTSERQANLIEENIDVAIRHGELSDSALKMRKLADIPLLTVTTPAYLAQRGEPLHPRDLVDHACIPFTGGVEYQNWRFRLPDGSWLQHQPQGRFRTNDGEQQLAAVLAGMGIVQSPGWLVAPQLQSGELVPILSDFAPASVAISALYSSRRSMNTRIQVFVDFLADTLAHDLRLFSIRQPGGNGTAL